MVVHKIREEKQAVRTSQKVYSKAFSMNNSVVVGLVNTEQQALGGKVSSLGGKTGGKTAINHTD